MISAKNIHKKYGELEILKGITVDINKSEIISVVGSSGA
jgi:lipoprotein-releasing system ATP-binding protein